MYTGNPDDALCPECNVTEDENHYIFNCTRFSEQRDCLFESIEDLTGLQKSDISLQNILGTSDFDFETKVEIELLLQKYIKDTKRGEDWFDD